MLNCFGHLLMLNCFGNLLNMPFYEFDFGLMETLHIIKKQKLKKAVSKNLKQASLCITTQKLMMWLSTVTACTWGNYWGEGKNRVSWENGAWNSHRTRPGHLHTCQANLIIHWPLGGAHRRVFPQSWAIIRDSLIIALAPHNKAKSNCF